MTTPLTPSSSSFPAPADGLWRHRGSAALVFFAFLALYLFGNGSHQLWDRDEPRYAVATAEMLRSRDFVIPHFNGEIRYEKPAMIYWLMAVPMKLLGETNFAARLAQSVSGALAIVLVFLAALRLGASARGALVAALAGGLSPLVMAVSKSATIDAVLLLAVMAAMLAHIANLREGFSWGRHLAFYICLGFAVLLKGPAGLVFAGAAVAGERVWTWLGRRRGWFPAPETDTPARVAVMRTVVGVLALLAVVSPWAIAAWVKTGGDFFLVQLREHALSHALSGKEGHTGPLYYYLPVLLIAAGAALPPLLATIPWATRAVSRIEVRMLAAWFLGGLVVFSFTGTKLPHYMVPVVAAWVMGAGLAWGDIAGGGQGKGQYRKWIRAGAVLLATIGIAVGIGMGVLIAMRLFPLPPAGLLSVGAFLGGGFVVSAVYWWRGRADAGMAVAVSSWVAAWIVVLGVILPALDALRPSRHVAEWLRAYAPPGTELMAVEYQEPSLVFYWGGQVTMMGRSEGREAVERLADTGRPAALVLPRSRLAKWIQHPEFGALPPDIGEKYAGRFYDFQSGDGWIELVVLGNWAAPESARR